jgi:ribokinase
VRSALDPGECHAGEDLAPPPRRIVSTAGGEGGTWTGTDHTRGNWHTVELPGPRGDAYGAGDSFAGALTWALGDGRELGDALQVAARAGAAKMTGRAGYDGQLTAAEL